MRLTAIAFAGIRGLADASYDLAPTGTPASRVDVTGPPGAGLTSFLRAIAFTGSTLATHAPNPASKDILPSDGLRGTIETRWLLDEEEQRVAGLRDGACTCRVDIYRGRPSRLDADPGLIAALSRSDHAGRVGKLVYLHAPRVTNDPPTGLSDFVAEQRRHQFSERPAKFASFVRALAQFGGNAVNPQFARVAATLTEMCDTVTLTGVEHGQLRLRTSRGAMIGVDELSHGERSALVLSAAPALLGLERAIVLLDAPELGTTGSLGARWMRRLVADAPGAQWIVATRAEEVLGDRQDKTVVRLGGAR